MTSGTDASVPDGDDDQAFDRAFDPDPVVEAYKGGVDRTLLRRNLLKTPTERVEDLMALQRFAEEARRAGRRLRP